MKSKFLKLSAFVAVFLFLSFHVTAQTNWNQIIKTAASHRTTKSAAGRGGSDFFGFSVAVDGNYAVVGAYQEDEDANGSNSVATAGSVIIFENIAGVWTQIKKIVAADRGVGDRFGWSVAISSTTVVVGAPQEDEDAGGLNTQTGAGSVYIFSKDQGGANNWGQVKKIVPSDRGLNDQFGYSVAISGTIVVVGAYLEDEDANVNNTFSNAGSAYIFGKDQGGTNNWGQVKKIVASDRAAEDNFGISVAISGNAVVVGAYFEDQDASGSNTASNAGSAYIFSKDQGGTDNWGQVKKIVASDRAADDNFGWSVAISGNTLVVGAFLEDEDANGTNSFTNTGSAYLFSKDQGGTDNWGQVKKIVASDRAAEDRFGFSVAISGTTVVVGAYQEDEDANGSNTFSSAGSAYIFSKDQGGTENWGQVKKIVASDRAADDRFAWSVAISDTIVVVGAYMEDEDANGTNSTTNAGSAYIFSKDQGATNNWGQQQKLEFIDAVTSQFYGYSVAIDGNYAVVGAYGEVLDANGVNPLLLAGAAYILKNTGGVWTQIKKIVASDRGAIDDRFGWSVAISGNTVVVGAYAEDHDASGGNTASAAGSAYVFSKDEGGGDNWGQVKKIVASDRAADDRFGWSVAISDTIVVVGAYLEDEDGTGSTTLSNAGSAYIFSMNQGGSNNWGQVKKIVASDRAAEDRFGVSVAISGNTVVVGAFLEDEDAAGLNTQSGAGSIYIFSKDQGGSNNWGQVKKIVASDRAVDDNFGMSVAISGNTVVVGAYLEDEDAAGLNNLPNTGSAYIFSKDQGGSNNWGQVKKIVASDRAANDYFGYSVAISGTTVVVGAYLEDHNVSGGAVMSTSGSAYIFSKDQGGTNNWGQVQKIVASDRATDDRFGWTVAISGSTIIVCAILEDEDAGGGNTLGETGSAYFFAGCSSSTIPTTNSQSISGITASATQTLLDGDCKLLATLTSNGTTPVSGHINAKEWIQSTQPATYVKRHYEITPVTNTNTATATVTLYFTQAEFDDYNNFPNASKLPQNTSDASGKANLRIEKRGGTSSDGSGLPNTYSGSIVTIDPADSDIVWNATESRWEVSFAVEGFSGFFVNTSSSTLPVTWLSLNGVLNNHKQAVLTWNVEESEVLHYEVEVSNNATSFTNAGKVLSKGNGQHTYSFTHQPEINGTVWFRIKQTDANGKVSYSSILRLMNQGSTSVSVYPKPATSHLVISVSSELQNSNARLVDLNGRVLKTIRLNGHATQVSISELPAGLYLLQLNNGITEKIIKQ